MVAFGKAMCGILVAHPVVTQEGQWRGLGRKCYLLQSEAVHRTVNRGFTSNSEINLKDGKKLNQVNSGAVEGVTDFLVSRYETGGVSNFSETTRLMFWIKLPSGQA